MYLRSKKTYGSLSAKYRFTPYRFKNHASASAFKLYVAMNFPKMNILDQDLFLLPQVFSLLQTVAYREDMVDNRNHVVWKFDKPLSWILNGKKAALNLEVKHILERDLMESDPLAPVPSGTSLSEKDVTKFLSPIHSAPKMFYVNEYRIRSNEFASNPEDPVIILNPFLSCLLARHEGLECQDPVLRTPNDDLNKPTWSCPHCTEPNSTKSSTFCKRCWKPRMKYVFEIKGQMKSKTLKQVYNAVISIMRDEYPSHIDNNIFMPEETRLEKVFDCQAVHITQVIPFLKYQVMKRNPHFHDPGAYINEIQFVLEV